MSLKISQVLILTCLFSLFVEISSGALCVPACLVFCAANPVTFAGALVSGGIAEIGCLPGCGIACSMGLFVPVACFSDETLIKVKDSDKIIEKKIEDIKRDDFVLTISFLLWIIVVKKFSLKSLVI